MRALINIPLLLASCGSSPIVPTPPLPPPVPTLPTFTQGESVKITALNITGTTYFPPLSTRIAIGEVCTVNEVSPNFSGWYWVKCQNGNDVPLYATMLEVNP